MNVARGQEASLGVFGFTKNLFCRSKLDVARGLEAALQDMEAAPAIGGKGARSETLLKEIECKKLRQETHFLFAIEEEA